ncbi:MAG: chorismate mutase [Verrucomicrobium sp.]|nr:chorismate mutase [Verrucomicrobium sp.]
MTLAALRAQIEKVDAEIIRLLNTRTRLSIRVGQFKRKAGRPSFTPEREEFLLRHLETKRGRGPLPAADLRAIYREIFSSSRARQKRVMVGYLEDGGAALLTAWYRFGAGESYLPAASWTALCAALRRKKADVAVCSAPDLAEALAKHGPASMKGLRACGEVRVPGRDHELFYLLEPGDAAEEPAPAGDSAKPRRLFLAPLSPAAARRLRAAGSLLQPAGWGRYLVDAGPRVGKAGLRLLPGAIPLGTFFTSETA